MQRFDGGALSISYLSKADYEASGAEETYSEGVVDHLRALQGTVVAALVRHLAQVAERERDEVPIARVPE